MRLFLARKHNILSATHRRRNPCSSFKRVLQAGFYLPFIFRQQSGYMYSTGSFDWRSPQHRQQTKQIVR